MSEWSVELSRRVDSFAAAHRLQAPLLEQWRALAAGDAVAIVDLAELLRLGENHLRDVLDWADEIAVRDGTTIAAVLGAEPLRAVLARDLGRNEAIKAVREALRRLRFPRLVETEDRLARQVRELRLPPGVRLVLPANLNDTEVRIEIRAVDAESLRAAVDSLRAAVQRRELADLFALMNGMSEATDEHR